MQHVHTHMLDCCIRWLSTETAPCVQAECCILSYWQCNVQHSDVKLAVAYLEMLLAQSLVWVDGYSLGQLLHWCSTHCLQQQRRLGQISMSHTRLSTLPSAVGSMLTRQLCCVHRNSCDCSKSVCRQSDQDWPVGILCRIQRQQHSESLLQHMHLCV